MKQVNLNEVDLENGDPPIIKAVKPGIGRFSIMGHLCSSLTALTTVQFRGGNPGLPRLCPVTSFSSKSDWLSQHASTDASLSSCPRRLCPYLLLNWRKNILPSS